MDVILALSTLGRKWLLGQSVLCYLCANDQRSMAWGQPVVALLQY